jgi:hypothetical protein
MRGIIIPRSGVQIPLPLLQLNIKYLYLRKAAEAAFLVAKWSQRESRVFDGYQNLLATMSGSPPVPFKRLLAGRDCRLAGPAASASPE